MKKSIIKKLEELEKAALYWSLFWTDPPEMPIPEKYL